MVKTNAMKTNGMLSNMLLTDIYGMIFVPLQGILPDYR
jgi:hypothetical protein